MNFKLLLLIPYSLLLIPACIGQKNVEFNKKNFKEDPAGFKNAMDSMSAGDKYLNQGAEVMYFLAIPYYLTAEKFNPDNDRLNYRIGLCMLSPNSPVKTDALPYLQKAYSLNHDIDPEIHYLLGRGYHLNMEWEKAIQEYNTFLQTLSPNNNMDRISDTKKKIEECKTGEKLVKTPVKVKIENMGPNINTEYQDYEPLISADESEIIFTSSRPGSTGGKTDPNTGRYYDDLYISYYKDSAWTPAENMGSPINTDDHDATAGISPDGQTLYIYRGDHDGDIYESHLKGLTWTKPEHMSSKINSPDQETTVSLGPDGKTLYFVSDRPSGFGGKDIYKTVYTKGSGWSDAVNLGFNINTKYDEEGVSIQADGKTLYFSSKGHNTMGGFDIFKSVLVKGKWSVPENVGYPINTPDDDLFFCMSANGKHAYYSSARKGGYGDKDIYMITFKKDSVVNTPKITLVKGIITDSATHQPIEASIEITDNKKNEVVASFHSNSSTGKYLVSLPAGVNYGIAVKAENYLFYSANFNVSDSSSKYSEVLKNISLQPLNVGSRVVLRNIFFDVNKSTLSAESTGELEKVISLLNTSPTLKIEISGYTDNVGTAEYNKELSESRAKAVVDYLIAHGIPSGRLSYKGYGKENPIASNDTEEGKQQNRRTEFKIVGK